jgi:beta-lactamase family protein
MPSAQQPSGQEQEYPGRTAEMDPRPRDASRCETPEARAGWRGLLPVGSCVREHVGEAEHRDQRGIVELDHAGNTGGCGGQHHGAVGSKRTVGVRWYKKFHLGDGRAQTGAQVLPAAVLRQMRQPTAELRGSSLGDALGIGWFLRDIDGVRTVGHDGSANGQFANLLTVPDRDFAVAVLSNAGPDGGLAVNRAVVRFALDHYLGVTDRDPQPLPTTPHGPQRSPGSTRTT